MNATTNLSTAPHAAIETRAETMRAVVRSHYGEPDVLSLAEVAKPVCGPDDVVVRVHSAAVSIGDHHGVTGKPYLIRLSPFGGLPRPKHAVPGAALAGKVVAIGSNVTTLRSGDDVFGQAAHGAFAEYVVVPAAHVVAKPANVSFDEAAAIPWAATALLGLRGVQAGQRVLINGASGGVGTWAVQLAKVLGAKVTAVCSTRNVELVRGLGADEVIDYTKQDFVTGGARFDVMMDMVGNRSVSECLSVLNPKGTYVPCSGGGGDWVGPMVRIIWVLLRCALAGKKANTFVMAPNQKDLTFLKETVEAGKAKPIIERRYRLDEIGTALRHVGDGHTQGQTVVQVVG